VARIGVVTLGEMGRAFSDAKRSVRSLRQAWSLQRLDKSRRVAPEKIDPRYPFGKCR
jgi:hypothetical protein